MSVGKDDYEPQPLPIREATAQADERYGTPTRHRPDCLTTLYTVLAITVASFILVFRLIPHLKSGYPSARHTQTLGDALAHDRPDNPLNYTRTERLYLDADTSGSIGRAASIGISEKLRGCNYEWNATGQITFTRGNFNQEQSFLAVAEIAASSKMALDSVQLRKRSDVHYLFVDCVDFPRAADHDEYASRPNWPASARVDLTIFVKPGTKQLGETEVTTDALDVVIGRGLDFETSHMMIWSANSDIVGMETESFFAHDIEIHTSNGAITGDWSLPSSIELSTGTFRSKNGNIDINLPPKRYSYGPWTPGTLKASTSIGDINIRMPLEHNKLGLRNMSIDMSSKSGSISGTFETGIYTSFVTGHNASVNATLLPFFQLPVRSSIVTSAEAGDTFVRVLPPVRDSYYKINPLLDTKSEHVSLSGSIDLRYPLDWAGTAVGVSDEGTVDVIGDAFDHVMRDEHLVVARKGTGMGSRLDFKTHNGTGALRVG